MRMRVVLRNRRGDGVCPVLSHIRLQSREAAGREGERFVMAGYHQLFIPGPTNMPERIRSAIDRPMENHRAPDFGELTLPLLEDLKKVFKTQHGSVFVFPGTGTGGWQATIANTLSPGDTVLAARHGQFSDQWIQLCRAHGLNVRVCDRSWHEGVPTQQFAEILRADTDHEIKAVLTCHNETATGVTSDIAAVRRALDDADHPALLFVDGISSIASLDFRMDDWGVDAAVASSQKGFMMPTGLAIVALSPKALEAAKTSQLGSFYFDVQRNGMAHQNGFFPYTPATTLLYGLRESVNMLLEEGMDNVAARHNRLARGVRAAVHAWGLDLCGNDPALHSDTVSTVMVPDGVDGGAVVRHAYERYDMALGGGLGPLAGRVFRIGHMGYVNEIMLLGALGGVEMTLRDCGAAIEPGAGVAAAQTAFRAADTATAMAAE